jgi:quercetin dioxygenase-like cupin family protein
VIVRNVNDEEVLQTTYQAHGGAVARMILDSSVLKEILFLAYGVLEPGKTIEPHLDPYEEIYFLLQGEGTMSVDNDTKEVHAGDAIWIPIGSVHTLTNNGEENCVLLVVAALPRR